MRELLERLEAGELVEMKPELRALGKYRRLIGRDRTYFVGVESERLAEKLAADLRRVGKKNGNPLESNAWAQEYNDRGDVSWAVVLPRKAGVKKGI